MAEERIGLRVEFEAAQFEKEVRAYNAALGQAYESTAKYSEQLMALSDTGIAADEAMARLAQQMAAQGASYSQIVQQCGEAAASEIEFTVNTERAAEATAKLGNASAAVTEEIGEQAQATEKAGQKTKNIITDLVKWGFGVSSVLALYNKLRRELGEAFKELYGGTEAYKAITQASDDFWRSMVTAAASASDVEDVMQSVADGINEAALMIRQAAATVSAFAAFFGEIKKGVQEAALILTSSPWGDFIGSQSDKMITAMGTFYDTYHQRLAEQEEQLKAAAQGMQEYQRALEQIVAISKDWDEEMGRHTQRIQEINAAWGQAQVSAAGELYAQMHRITLDEQAQITKINEGAAKDREQAIANTAQRIEQMQAQARDEERKNAAQHALEMEFAQRRHNLSMVQNDRVYQSSRNRLVAEGDVLAIEELDERHALERQSQEENFALQMQQAEAMYQLQARYQQEANRQQIASLKMTLDEQLREIEERRREQVEAEQAAAEEERMQAKLSYADALGDAKTAQLEQLSAEEEGHQERLKALGEALTEYARKNNLTLDEVLDLWQSYYGPDSAMDTAIRDAYVRYEGYLNSYAQAVETAMARVRVATQAAAVPTASTGAGDGGYRYMMPSRLRTQQYGGEDVVSTPTHFLAGEEGPERVSVTPMSSIGNGAMSLSWQGGPIPVQGQGSLEGADLSQIGNQLTIAIMSRMRTEIGRHGRRA